MNSIWQPVQWFVEVFNLVIDIEFFPGLSFGSICLGLLTIVLIFRMIIFPLTGGSVLSSLSGISGGIVHKRANSNRKENK